MNSHLPVLRAVCSAIEPCLLSPIKSLEFGCGDYSTVFFIAFGCEHHAIEVIGTEHDERSREWYQLIKDKFGDKAHISIAIMHDAMHMLADIKPDITFVDGAGYRVECVNKSFAHSSVIIAHDTEAECYGWERVRVPYGWTQLTRGSDVVPDPIGEWTTVWTRNDNVINALKDAGLTERKIPRGR